MEWKNAYTTNVIPPLLQKGGFDKTNFTVITKLARIFLDLFCKNIRK